MTLERGGSWGAPGALPADGRIARSDAEVRAAVETARRAGTPLPVIGLLGGDLCRTLGGRGDERRLRSQEAAHLPVDVVRATIDGVDRWFVAHLVAARPTWSAFCLAMNAQWRGRWDVAPAGHPGDGVVDVLQGELRFGDRIEAWRRVRSGTHVPHPGIAIVRARSTTLRWEQARTVVLDGERVGRATSVELVVEAAALTVVV